MQSIQNTLGHKGHSVWWILVELCAEKLEKPKDGTFEDASFRFVFNQRFLRSELRLSGANVARYLHQFATLALLSCTLVKDEWHLEMPKLLESLDRDTRRARHERAPGAPKIKKKIKIKNIKEMHVKVFEELAEKYIQLFPGTTKGSKALDRFVAQCDVDNYANDLDKAIQHYRTFLDDEGNSWRKPKTTFETFLGTKSSGYFWRDFIAMPTLEKKKPRHLDERI